MSSRLQAAREDRGLSRAKVAAQLGLSQQQLYRLERGVTPAKRVHLLALASVYDVPIADLEAMAEELLTRAEEARDRASEAA